MGIKINKYFVKQGSSIVPFKHLHCNKAVYWYKIVASFISGHCLEYTFVLYGVIWSQNKVVQTQRCILLDFLIIFLLPFGFTCVGNKQRHVFQRIFLHFWHWSGLLSDKEVRSGFHIAKRRIEAVNPWSFASLRPPLSSTTMRYKTRRLVQDAIIMLIIR